MDTESIGKLAMASLHGVSVHQEIICCMDVSPTMSTQDFGKLLVYLQRVSIFIETTGGNLSNHTVVKVC